MEFYKSLSNSSTSSNNSNSSHKSHVSSNNGASYGVLEYCTSSSSLSPFASCPRSAAASSSSSACSSAKKIIIDELIIPSSGGSTSRSSTHLSSSQNVVNRKRSRSVVSLDDKDPEIGFEPPLAKRQQRLPSFYQSDAGSVVSSVYPSPVDELVNEIDTRSSSDCLSTGTEYDVAADDMPDSPSSLQADEDDVDDDEIGSSPTATSSNSVKILSQHVAAAPAFNPHPHSHHHHGERTPGQRQDPSAHVNAKNSTTAATKPKVKSFDDYLMHYACMTPAAEMEPPRMCPLPALSWANAQDVWQLMCKKDEEAACYRDAAMLEHHPGLQPRMRAILLDWLIEVCEVYKLHRETYYLAVDYLDRYLSTQKKVQKTHLQLIGITCLFIAAKVEEIYPPKIGEFAYVTDGACQEEDILLHEILLLQALEWKISPVTAMGWLGVYMQLNVNNRTPASFSTNDSTRLCGSSGSSKQEEAGAARQQRRKMKSVDQPPSPATYYSNTELNDAFIYPQFSGMEFVQTAQLLDLCSLDVGIGNFAYSVIAAAAISHTFNRETALRCSGLDWQSIQLCARWMEPFFKIICEESEHLHLLEQNEQLSSKYGLAHVCPNIVTDDSHIIQTHTTTMEMFDRAAAIQTEYQTKYLTYSKIKQEASPATGLVCPEGLLTPPASSRKSVGADADDEAQHVQQNKNTAMLAANVYKH